MKCAVYIRVTNGHPVGEISLHYQQDLLFQQAQEKGLDIYQCYVDFKPRANKIGQSLLQMLKDAEENKFNIILTKKSSLFDRNRKILNKISELSERLGIQIITLEETKELL